MRTNIFMDDALMKQAMQASGVRSKWEAVQLGLRTLVKLQQQAEIRAFRGRLAWEGDLEAFDRAQKRDTAATGACCWWHS
ncbi:type II toxin-antitoxin system VapB family antitoxin [Synechococcus sp. CS-1331]|uniref:type II toxin-antitoxin system VapB family antitoxin n=1 Tax=Synechococcus sp. CS-1331 TaxID=2847973 RepID=UPI00223BD85A|nr:type II toxin-antitoxin system VapB family antitoxin [Synechococcus sp. CS-1331]MCT0227088.1 type II toxin-antitoxin system VapB family antitoxin [Synechococcus sp. CS-1331]